MPARGLWHPPRMAPTVPVMHRVLISRHSIDTCNFVRQYLNTLAARRTARAQPRGAQCNIPARTQKSGRQAHWRGVCNVIMPSFSADLQRLNEAAIRHDVRRNIELGFWGALLVSECGTTDAEYRRFMEIAVDEAKGRQHFLIHGTFDTANRSSPWRRPARTSASPVFSGPSQFLLSAHGGGVIWHLETVANNTRLGVCLFATVQMNLSRFHPSGYPPGVLARAADLPNVVAVKYEVGRPRYRRRSRVLEDDPRQACVVPPTRSRRIRP